MPETEQDATEQDETETEDVTLMPPLRAPHGRVFASYSNVDEKTRNIAAIPVIADRVQEILTGVSDDLGEYLSGADETAIPDHVTEQVEALIDAGLADDVTEALEQLSWEGPDADGLPAIPEAEARKIQADLMAASNVLQAASKALYDVAGGSDGSAHSASDPRVHVAVSGWFPLKDPDED